jgi:hypothetical protein
VFLIVERGFFYFDFLMRYKGKRMPAKTLAVRVNASNPNHHLWNNNGTWWCHFTVHRPDFTKLRVRHSLNTGDVAVARKKRDTLLDA